MRFNRAIYALSWNTVAIYICLGLEIEASFVFKFLLFFKNETVFFILISDGRLLFLGDQITIPPHNSFALYGYISICPYMDVCMYTLNIRDYKV